MGMKLGMTGAPSSRVIESVAPDHLMTRMLLVGYCYGIRSERHLNLAYRWFCRLGLDGDVPDHSTFSKNRWSAHRVRDRPCGADALPRPD